MNEVDTKTYLLYALYMRIYNMCGSSLRNRSLEFGIFKSNGEKLVSFGVRKGSLRKKGIKNFGPFWWTKS